TPARCRAFSVRWSPSILSRDTFPVRTACPSPKTSIRAVASCTPSNSAHVSADCSTGIRAKRWWPIAAPASRPVITSSRYASRATPWHRCIPAHGANGSPTRHARSPERNTCSAPRSEYGRTVTICPYGFQRQSTIFPCESSSSYEKTHSFVCDESEKVARVRPALFLRSTTMKTTWLKTAIAIAAGALSTQALAAGFALNEQSISGMGTSFAGRSSSADDATTLFGTPAGMSRLKREEVSFGVAAIHAKTDIKNTSGFPGNGSNDGDMVPFTAVPMGYYVKPLDDKWAIGVGVYVPFGLITDYEGGFEGRYHGDYSEVRVITVQPTVSYRFNEKLSIGFGPTINRIDGQLESAVPPATLGATADSRVKIKG